MTASRPSAVIFRLLHAALLSGVLAAGSASAADDERFSVSLGVFVTDRSTTTRVDASPSDPGTDVDLEGDLGLDSSDSVFRIDGYYKFSRRHRIDFSWFDLSRTASKRIERDIEWDGTLYPIDVTVNTNFDLDIYKLAYTWSFLSRERGFLGLTGGLYIAEFGLGIEASALGQRDVGDATAPLPVVGLRGEYHLTDKWSFRASGELFALEYGDWDGSLVDVYAGLDYQLFPSMSLGIGYNSVTVDIGVTKENLTGNVDWGYAGGLVFFKFDF